MGIIMYLNKSLIEDSFLRLTSKKQGGKTTLERTSALMYFLSFDATVKKLNKSPIDFNPNAANGKNNRSAMELEFVRLVKLHSPTNSTIRQVSILGEIDENGNTPEKRISSNFFTVPLKKASQISSEFVYPHRPSPVFKMGELSTGLSWGIDYFDEWDKNLPKLLSDTKSRTPFIDLSLFVFRCSEIPSNSKDLWPVLFELIRKRFSNRLSGFWCKRISSEKVFWQKPKDLFQQTFLPALLSFNEKEISNSKRRDLLLSLRQDRLIDRILYLEDLLNTYNIAYTKTRGAK
jgi:hypothetical protein